MLQLSHFKLLAGVVFALFILTACGGGDSAAPAAATNNTDSGDNTGGDNTGGGDGGNTDGGNTGGDNTGGGDGGNTDGGDSGGGAVTCTDANQHVVNNACTDYTQATCQTDGKYWDSSSCVAKITSCTDSNHIVVAVRNACETDNYTPKGLADFDDTTDDTDEYSTSKALEPVNAAQAYVNIENLINADNMAAADSAIKQGGEGQTVSLAFLTGFNTTHQEFDADGTLVSNAGDGSAFSSIYNASGTLYENAAIISTGKCGGANCEGTTYAALIAGRKTDTGIHGIAYNAKLKGIITNRTQAQLLNAISAGVGADIVAMNHAWNTNPTTSCYNHPVHGAITYNRPEGQNVRTANADDTCTTNIINSDQISGTELTAWKNAVKVSDDTKKTIMVFGAGNEGMNSENGFSSLGSSVLAVTVVANGDSSANPMAANIPDYYAAYPALYTESGTDFTSDRWLAVTGLDTNDKILTSANGCGVAMSFCLSAPGDAVDSASKDSASNAGYDSVSSAAHASSTVAGALAVLKGAFPNATPEQLTRLVLETSDYIPLATHDDETNRVQATKPDGTAITGRYINPVYGWGKLNLQAATHMDVDISTLSIGNNESIGALWKDTQLTLSSHFGSNFESVKFGIGDAYGRHFITAAPQTSYAPVTTGFDEYMGNMLADNVQSQTLGGQAKLNYSNNAQPWMNLEYTSGKATSKIAFQDNYKVKPLHNDSATSILRANNIRPASNNIGMMDIDYALNGNLSLSSYAARGEYDTGYKFDELGTDFDVNYKKSHLNIAIGNIREHDQFLGTHTTGGYALNAPTVSRFTDVTYGHDVGAKFNIYANYINYETDVDMLHDQFASIDNLQADQYQIGFTGKNLMSDDDNLNVALITKLGVTDGALNQNTTLGYTADGAFNDVSQSYDLAVSERHQQFEITYQGKIYQNSQDGVSVLKDNRFFTTIRVDQNLNHEEGVGQTEIVTGMQAKF